MRSIILMAAGSLIAFAKADDKGSAPAAEAPAAEVADEGVRARRAIMLKQFLPGEGVDWINKNIVAHGKGTRATLGRVFGICTGYEVRTNTLPDGTPSQSIALKGAFQTESYMTGELGEGTLAFLPAAYGEKVKAIFDANERRDTEGKVIGNDLRMVEVDCDVGVEATGKTIPYEWVIIAFREGEEMAVLKRMRQSRARPAYVMHSDALQIAAVARPALKPLAMLESAAPAAQGAQEAETPAPEGEAA